MTSPERALQLFSIAAYVVLNVWAYVEMFAGGWHANMTGWVYNYQTLVAGALAIVSALIGAWFLARQTSQVERHERERLLRRREAVRTVLPLALSTITRYSVDAALATKLLLDQCQGESLPDRAQLTLPENPPLPGDAIGIVREMVEAVTADEIASLAILVADIQVQASRLGETITKAGDKEKVLAKLNLEEYVIDCAMIYARAGSMFKFARGSAPTLPPAMTWSDVHSALYFFEMLGSDYDRIRETMLRRSGNDLNNPVAPRWSAREF